MKDEERERESGGTQMKTKKQTKERIHHSVLSFRSIPFFCFVLFSSIGFDVADFSVQHTLQFKIEENTETRKLKKFLAETQSSVAEKCVFHVPIDPETRMHEIDSFFTEHKHTRARTAQYSPFIIFPFTFHIYFRFTQLCEWSGMFLVSPFLLTHGTVSASLHRSHKHKSDGRLVSWNVWIARQIH